MVSSIIMQIRDFLQLVAQLPEWLLYFGVPALLVVTGLILAVVHADRAYPPVALFLGAVGLFLFASIAVELTDYAVWAAVYLAVAALVRLLFLIPFPKKKEKDRGDALYDAFYAPLEEDPLAEEDAMPPALSAEEGSLQLAHVDSLVEKLRGAELEPADRLELDAVVRSLDVYRGKDLTAGQQRALNDCLSAVLKLTAKYSL